MVPVLKEQTGKIDKALNLLSGDGNERMTANEFHAHSARLAAQCKIAKTQAV